MNRTFYESKMSEMLEDKSTYIEIDEKRCKMTKLKINKLVQKHKNCLHEDETSYILNFEEKESNLYGLPKIHKSNIIKEKIKEQNSEYITVHNPSDLKFRPIIAGPESATSRLSHLVDILLKDIPPLTKSHVRDDIDFLSKLQRNLLKEHQYSLVTFDVESLYTNIDQELGISAIMYWLKKYSDKIHPRFTNDFICDAVKIVLENNTFFFNDKLYLQTNGTAMGTKMAPTYANLVLAYLEEKLYLKLRTDVNPEFSNYIEKNFLRYLDDCFIIWPHSNWNLDNFEQELNSSIQNLNLQWNKTLKNCHF